MNSSRCATERDAQRSVCSLQRRVAIRAAASLSRTLTGHPHANCATRNVPVEEAQGLCGVVAECGAGGTWGCCIRNCNEPGNLASRESVRVRVKDTGSRPPGAEGAREAASQRARRPLETSRNPPRGAVPGHAGRLSGASGRAVRRGRLHDPGTRRRRHNRGCGLHRTPGSQTYRAAPARGPRLAG